MAVGPTGRPFVAASPISTHSPSQRAMARLPASAGVRRRPPYLQARADEVGHELLELLVLTGRLDLDLDEEIVGEVDRRLHGPVLPGNHLSVSAPWGLVRHNSYL